MVWPTLGSGMATEQNSMHKIHTSTIKVRRNEINTLVPSYSSYSYSQLLLIYSHSYPIVEYLFPIQPLAYQSQQQWKQTQWSQCISDIPLDNAILVESDSSHIEIPTVSHNQLYDPSRDSPSSIRIRKSTCIAH